ncbi:acyltransferase domain-containing protein [Winogradskya humida]|uniref:Malonyl-CoA:ACP transacylase (MAT) domain-containing protein n=1 Tax=Winogradskya humida TaxID=113566 RepID=A0ABQ3ZYD9_9ACTN|nr:acyltransferase domain-containing protein [Actinoplanes humidus]GIE23584.1 hypothetical protein Ahu01nite_066860 [Actinoplanes humidus]
MSENGVVFVFPGQGAQWDGMARELLDTAPEFAAEMDRAAAALDPLTGWSLLDVLRGVPGAPELDRVDVVQPVLFAMYVSLTALWRSHGVEPSAVIGHSQGEIAAAYVAGALDLNDAARVIAQRSRLLAELAGTGGMGSLVLSAEKAQEYLRRWPGRLTLAAINGPQSVVVSGEVAALNELLVQCFRDDVMARKVKVDYASHSPLMEPLREPILADLASISPRSGVVPFYSSTTADLVDTAGLDARYWFDNLRGAVLFEPALRAAVAGHRTVIEVSPHPVLLEGIRAIVAAAGSTATAVGTLRRGHGGLAQFEESRTEIMAVR